MQFKCHHHNITICSSSDVCKKQDNTCCEAVFQTSFQVLFYLFLDENHCPITLQVITICTILSLQTRPSKWYRTEAILSYGILKVAKSLL